MSPKFSVNELVTLQSLTHPEFNGEYTVLGVYKLNREDKTIKFPGLPEGKVLQFKNLSSEFVYDLGNFLNAKYVTLNDEFEIKKKQEPGQMGYKELMTSLKDSVLEWN